MRLLIIGGTMFLGRHLVRVARERGHELTLFNRGQTAPGLFGDVEQIHGDRARDLDRLDGRTWDAVIDTCGYLPGTVRASASRLGAAAGHYTFVSSISAYASFAEPGNDEDSPMAELADPGSEDAAAQYGALKAGCEREVLSEFGERALIVRPGLIVGPDDPTERFTYWVRQLAAGGRVLVPQAAAQPVQLIDVRDLAEWMIRLIERGQSGVFNAAGPKAPLSFTGLIECLHSVVNPQAELHWVAEETLAAAGVEPWDELPLWLDLERHAGFRGFLAADISRALRTGLSLRTLQDTAADTLAWARRHSAPAVPPTGVRVPRPGLTDEHEAALERQLSEQQRK